MPDRNSPRRKATAATADHDHFDRLSELMVDLPDYPQRPGSREKARYFLSFQFVRDILWGSPPEESGLLPLLVLLPLHLISFAAHFVKATVQQVREPVEEDHEQPARRRDSCL